MIDKDGVARCVRHGTVLLASGCADCDRDQEARGDAFRDDALEMRRRGLAPRARVRRVLDGDRLRGWARAQAEEVMHDLEWMGGETETALLAARLASAYLTGAYHEILDSLARVRSQIGP